MPIVRIEESMKRDNETKTMIIQSIFQSLRSIFGVTDDELQARYDTYSAEDFVSPLGKLPYIHIEITIFSGRLRETKKRLYTDIVVNLSTLLKIDPAAILILLNEHSSENWGMQGGRAACDLDFGYEIIV